MKNINVGVIKLINILGGGILGFSIFFGLIECYKQISLLAFALLTLFIIGICGIKKKLDFNKLFLLLLGVYIFISFFVATKIMVEPSWDFKGIYENSVSLAQMGKLADRGEVTFSTYPNNIFTMLIYCVWYKILIIFGFTPSVFSGMVLNAICIYISIFFTYKCCTILLGKREAFACLPFLLLFLPFVGYIPILYTDTMALPFVCISIFIEIICNNTNLTKEKILWLTILEGIFLGLGFKVKATVAIILVAIILSTIIECLYNRNEKLLGLIKRSVLILCFFIVTVSGLNIGISNSILTNKEESYDLQMPYTHWIKMGLKGVGGFDQDDVDVTMGIKGYDEKRTENVQTIKKRVNDYGLNGLIEHLKIKVKYTWGDGTYYSSNKLSRFPLADNFLSNLFRENGKYNIYFIKYSNAMHALLMVLLSVAIVKSIFVKRLNYEYRTILFSVYGITLFLWIWETRSRYLLHYYPLLIILGGYEIKNIMTILTKLKNK